MTLTLTRDRHNLRYTGGVLFLDGEFFCYTLEPGVPIPVGIYPVQLTVSPRAVRGELWTPDFDHRLPAICDVPGYEGIRFHAGNFPRDTEGCILVGDMRSEEAIYESRAALQRLIERFVAPCQLEIKDG